MVSNHLIGAFPNRSFAGEDRQAIDESFGACFPIDNFLTDAPQTRLKSDVGKSFSIHAECTPVAFAFDDPKFRQKVSDFALGDLF